jgi:hypothetical protein
MRILISHMVKYLKIERFTLYFKVMEMRVT